jgi:hypothetical protein
MARGSFLWQGRVLLTASVIECDRDFWVTQLIKQIIHQTNHPSDDIHLFSSLLVRPSAINGKHGASA